MFFPFICNWGRGCHNFASRCSSLFARRWSMSDHQALYARNLPYFLDFPFEGHLWEASLVQWIPVLVVVFHGRPDVIISCCLWRIVIKRKVFLRPHSGRQMFLLDLAEDPHGDLTPWAPPRTVAWCIWEDTLTLRLAMQR